MTTRWFRTLAARPKLLRAGVAALGGSLVLVTVGFVVQTVRGDGSDRQAVSRPNVSPKLPLSASGSREEPVSVPNLVGLNEGEAVKALAASGLIANVRYAEDAERTGKVLRSVPEAGTELAASSVVLLSIAPRPYIAPIGPEENPALHPLSHLVERNPEAFVGLYRDVEGAPHVVFGPGIDPATWEDRLNDAAGHIRYVTDRCSRDRKSLQAIHKEIATPGSMQNKRLAFGMWVHPESCTVRVESDLLTSEDIRTLVERYGTAISFDTTPGVHPVPLSSTD
ncbi:MAG TPA: PASTA domain-containing protein [Gaiellaceae bacterium]|nr:PASTA domain-containing protein [Gaiellaceae bacterium]